MAEDPGLCLVSMGRRGDWIRLGAVAGGYAAAFVLFRRAVPFSLESPWFVCLAMVCFLGLAFVARPVIAVRMPHRLRRIQAWESEGSIYCRLGVPAFGSLLRRTPLRLLNRDVYLAGANRSREELDAQLEGAEASHFWAALLVLPYMVRLSVDGAVASLFWVTVVQVLVNVYPFMHLRWTRHRLDRLALSRRRHAKSARGE